MKEIMDAFEAAVRRIVKEELAAAAPVAAPTAAFSEVVKQSVLDQPWFDEYVKSEVATAVDALPKVDSALWQPGEMRFLTPGTFDNAVADVLERFSRAQEVVNNLVERRIDYLDLPDQNAVEHMIEREMPDMDDYVEKSDLEDAVRSAVENLNFVVSVD